MNLLIVEDEKEQRELVARIIQQHTDHKTTEVESAEQAIALIEQRPFDLVLSDWKLSGKDGLELLEFVKHHHPSLSFVLVTAYGSISHAVSSIRSGADDYLSKPFEKQQLLFTIDKLYEARKIKIENEQLKQQQNERDRLGHIIGASAEMQKIYQRIEKVSDTNITVLIHGESGTGKELVAHALHQLSSRKNNIFLPVNCSAIPESLAEAELFGAEKGSYTGANTLKIGKIEAANNGTLFLDEVAELPASIQAKLLRVLQEGKIMRIGSNTEIDIDVRIISATHKNLTEEVAAGHFREDLFYRLNIVPFELPALRDRAQDLTQLLNYFNRRFTKKHNVPPLTFTKSATQAMYNYSWPGNIRELSNLVERLVVLNDGTEVAEQDMQFDHSKTIHQSDFELPTTGIRWDEFERSVLRQALIQTQNNRSKAAQLLSLNYKAFLYRLDKYNIQVPK